MADLSTLSDAELMALYKQQQQPVQAQPQDLSKMSDAELMALYNQQRTGATTHATARLCERVQRWVASEALNSL